MLCHLPYKIVTFIATKGLFDTFCRVMSHWIATFIATKGLFDTIYRAMSHWAFYRQPVAGNQEENPFTFECSTIFRSEL